MSGAPLKLALLLLTLYACRAIPDQTPRPSPPITPPIAPTLEPMRLEVRGLTTERDPVGHLRFLFEVANLGSRPVAGVRAVVRLLDSEQRVVGEGSSRTWLELIEPGRSAAVLVVFEDPPEFAEHRIELSAAEVDRIPSRIHLGTRIAAARWRRGQFVPYEILGKATNRGDEIAYNVSLIAICYDAQRRVVSITLGHPKMLALEPGQASPFRLEVLHTAAEVTLCKVHASAARPLSDPPSRSVTTSTNPR